MLGRLIGGGIGDDSDGAVLWEVVSGGGDDDGGSGIRLGPGVGDDKLRMCNCVSDDCEELATTCDVALEWPDVDGFAFFSLTCSSSSLARFRVEGFIPGPAPFAPLRIKLPFTKHSSKPGLILHNPPFMRVLPFPFLMTVPS